MSMRRLDHGAPLGNAGAKSVSAMHTKVSAVVFVKTPRRRVDTAKLDRARSLSHHAAEKHLVDGQRLEASGVEDNAAPRDDCTRSDQGETLRAAIVDQQIGRGTNTIASYVALTRVPSRSAHRQAIRPQALHAGWARWT